MAEFIALKSTACVVGNSQKGAKKIQADVRVTCDGGDRHLSLCFWVPGWAARASRTSNTGIEVAEDLLVEKEDGDLKEQAEKAGCKNVTGVEVLKP